MVQTFSQLTYRRVVGRLTALVQDSSLDADAYPDGLPLTANLTFTPEAKKVKVLGGSPSTSFMILKPITAALDSNGQICELVKNTDGSSSLGPAGVLLLVTDDPLTEPSGDWTWHVEFTDVGVVGYDSPGDDDDYLNDFSFELPSGPGDIDINDLEPAVSSRGVVTAVGPAGPPIDLVGSVANQAALPTGLTLADKGKSYQTTDTGNLWTWGGSAWRGPFLFRGPSGGAQGTAGPAPTFNVVVNTLAPGSTPTAAVTGTSPNLTLTLGLPTTPDIAIQDAGQAGDVVWSGAYLKQQFDFTNGSIDTKVADAVANIALPDGTVVRMVQNADGSYPTPTAEQARFYKQYLGDLFPTTGLTRGDTYELGDPNP